MSASETIQKVATALGVWRRPLSGLALGARIPDLEAVARRLVAQETRS